MSMNTSRQSWRLYLFRPSRKCLRMGPGFPGGRNLRPLQTEYRQLIQYYNIASIMAKCHNRAACMMLARNRGDYFTWSDRAHHGTSD